MPNQVVQYTLSLKDLLTDKINQANNSVNRLEGSLDKVKGAASSFGSAVGIAFGSAAVVAFGSKMITAGTQVENALTGLTTLLKDKAAAQNVINNTMEDATKTPFAFEGLLSANKALISAGVSATEARGDVLNLANAIAATGGGDDELQRMVVNLQQVKNTGKATAQDIKQFAFAGVNIYKVLADATGQPIEKVKEMEVSYDQLTMALAKAAGEGGIYANGLANMANNTSVQISNLGDSVFQFSVQMFNDLKPAIDTIVSGLATFVGWMRQGWEWLVRNKDLVQALAVGVAVAAVAWQAYLIVTGESVIVTGLLTAAQWALNIAMNANPIGMIIVAIGALTAGVMYAYNHFEKFRAVIWATWAVIKEFASIVTDVFTGVAKMWEGIFTFNMDKVKEGVTKTVSAYADAGYRIGKAAKDGYNAGLKDFAADQTSKTKAAPKNVVQGMPGAGGAAKGGAAVTPAKSETGKAQGQKVMNINISIGSLIKDFKISTTNMTEGAGKVRELVAQALLSATNDSQILAQ
jgi:tape measure domain-containing protein